MAEECEFCREEFSNTVIKEYENWTVQLYLNQYYLGRCLVKLNSHKIDLFNLEDYERKELFEEVVPEIKAALNGMFDPDLYNYASLGNDCRHLHLHVIPRYSSKRKFGGITFQDENWNNHYKPYPESFDLDEETFISLRDKIRDRLNY